MGAGASSKHEKREKESRRHRLMLGVERFVVNVYATCPRIESILLILSSDMSLRAFQNFVRSERAEENLALYSEIMDLQAKKLNPYQLSNEISRLIVTYIQPVSTSAIQVQVSSALRDSLVSVLTADKDVPDYMENIYKLLSRLQDETIFIMARDQLSRFILSKHYKNWRAAESSHAMATTVDDAAAAAAAAKARAGAGGGGAAGQSQFSKSGDPKKKLKHEDLSVRAFANFDINEIGNILGTESWLAALLAAVEGLPISFILSTARKDRRGFPVMYVNRFFEKVTGFSRSEVLGKSCKFLQCPETEKDKIAVLAGGLRSAVRVHTVLTNRKQSGERFQNLVAMKPVFDDRGVFCYVMAICIDVTREIDDYVSKITLVETLMDMLPELIITDDDDAASCLPMLDS